MKSTTIILLAVISIFYVNNIYGQDTDKNLSDAKSAYKSGNLEDARYALQQALNNVNTAIGKEILLQLPGSMIGLGYNSSQDNVTGTDLGYAGLYVKRSYGTTEEKSVSIEIVSDSPLLAGINTILSLPAIMSSGDPNQKRIKVDGYKALLERSEDDQGNISYSIQVPFGNSLLSVYYKGITSENDITVSANTIPVTKIAALSK